MKPSSSKSKTNKRKSQKTGSGSKKRTKTDAATPSSVSTRLESCPQKWVEQYQTVCQSEKVCEGIVPICSLILGYVCDTQCLRCGKEYGTPVALNLQSVCEHCVRCAQESKCIKCGDVFTMGNGGRCRPCGAYAQSRLKWAVWDSVIVTDEEFKSWKTQWPLVHHSIFSYETNLQMMVDACVQFNRFLTDGQLADVLRHAVVPFAPQNALDAYGDCLKTYVGLMMMWCYNPTHQSDWNAGPVEACEAYAVCQETEKAYKRMSVAELKRVVSEGPQGRKKLYDATDGKHPYFP